MQALTQVYIKNRCIHKLEASIDTDLYQKSYTQKNTNKNLGYIN